MIKNNFDTKIQILLNPLSQTNMIPVHVCLAKMGTFDGRNKKMAIFT